MIIPVRCQSCGKPIGHLYPGYKQKVAQGQDAAKVMDEMGLTRHCCRVHFLSNVDLLPTVAKFQKI